MMIDETGKVAHYTRLKHLEKILREKTIRISPVEEFSDPRESSLGWIDTCGIGLGSNIQEWDRAEEIKKAAGSQINIFCTVGKQDDALIDSGCPIESSIYGRPRMWSQYGDNSEGFCIIFNQERLNGKINGCAKKPEYLISDHVRYYEWLHMVPSGVTIEYGDSITLPSSKNSFDLLNSNQMLHSVYFKKSIDWEDECEYRWLLFSESGKPVLVSIDDCVEAVVLGCNFPEKKVPDTIAYCNILACQCYKLDYLHPKYKISPLKTS